MRSLSLAITTIAVLFAACALEPTIESDELGLAMKSPAPAARLPKELTAKLSTGTVSIITKDDQIDRAVGRWETTQFGTSHDFDRAVLVLKDRHRIVAVGVPHDWAKGEQPPGESAWDLLDLGGQTAEDPFHLAVVLYDKFFFGNEIDRATVGAEAAQSRIENERWVRPDIGADPIDLESPFGKITIAPRLNGNEAGVWCRWSTKEHGFSGEVQDVYLILRVGDHVVAVGAPAIGMAGGLSYMSSGWCMLNLGDELVPAEYAAPPDFELVLFRQEPKAVKEVFRGTITVPEPPK
jgi:hypothetical protein